jgi:colanic acid/amylovoran biosynthesis glycosyltransferase
MRIAYLVNRYPAVSHSFVRREILAIEALGHKVSRFSIRAPAADLPDAEDREEASKTSIVLTGDVTGLVSASVERMLRQPGRVIAAFVQTKTMAPRNWSGLIRRFAYVVEGIWLARALERAGVDHLHAHFGTNPAAVARVVRGLSGIPYSFTVHGPDEFDEPRQIDLGGKIAEASFVAAISNFGRSQLCRWTHADHWHKIVVVRCGLDQVEVEKHVMAEERDIDLCTIARLAPQKGLPILIEALGLLAGRGERPRTVLIGDGPLRSDLEEQARTHGVESQITLLGDCDGKTVSAMLRRSKLMVLPSFAEGLPVVIMEAFACGTPVVSTAIAGIPELVDQSCGWVVPAGSAELLADAISEALATPQAQRDERGLIGRQRVRERHDVRANARDLVQLMGGH